MNVLITNTQEALLASLNTEIIKTLRGEYDVEEIINTFSNFFFGKMVLDVTSIRNYYDITNFQKLSIGLPVDKIILMLPPEPAFSSPGFISKLISMGFYNFGTKLEEIEYLLQHQNYYKDVAHLHILESVSSAPVSVGNTIAPTQAVAMQTIVAMPQTRVLGVKNVTEHAGATTLVYLMKRELEKFYGLSVLAIEVNKRDFMYLGDESLISTNKMDFPNELLKGRNYNLVLVDINDGDISMCDDVLYLVEPSLIKLNKLLRLDRGVFDRLKGKKIILNKTLLAGGNVETFEYEVGVKVYDVIKPLDDRSNQAMLTTILMKLGLVYKK